MLRRNAAKKQKTYKPTEPQYLYDLWKRIRGVTGNKNHPKYKDYGGRGIGMHEPWRPDFPKFRAWMLENLGERPTPGHSLDRLDVNKGYKPGNLQWATLSQQARNQRSNRMITIGKKTKCLMEWCEIYDRDVKLAWMRIFQLGWDPLRALKTPPRKLTPKSSKLKVAEVLLHAAACLLGAAKERKFTLAKALKLIDRETAGELIDYVSAANYDRCSVVVTEFDGDNVDDRKDMESWLALKVKYEGLPLTHVVEQLRNEGNEIRRPVILDTIGDVMVEGRHRMALALEDRLKIPVVCIC